MAVDGELFERISDKETFRREVWEHFTERSERLGLGVHFNNGRAYEAFFHWTDDMRLIPARNPTIQKPCHLKGAAFLMYWLRRCSPVNEFTYEEMDSDVKFMLKYGREYLAFDLGYTAAQVYERGINGRNLPGSAFSLRSFDPTVDENDFVETVCEFLNSKNVSPHGIYLMLKAIFLRP